MLQVALAQWQSCSQPQRGAGLSSTLTAQPQYVVLKLLSSAESLDGHGPGHGKAELRLYEPSLVAEVRVRTDDIVTAVSQAERELKAYLETCKANTAHQHAVTRTPGLSRTPSCSALSGLLESRFRSKCPLLSVQDLQCVEDVSKRQLFCEGEAVDTSFSGNSMLFAAEHDGASVYTVCFMLSPLLSLANLPRTVHPSIRIRLAPGFVFAAYKFSGNSPNSAKVKNKAMKLESLCCQHGLQIDSRQLVVQQHHVKTAPRWLRVNEVMLFVTNFRTASDPRLDGSRPQSEQSDEELSRLVSPLSSFSSFLTEAGHRAERWPLPLGHCCSQPVPIQRYCSGRWADAQTGPSAASACVHDWQSPDPAGKARVVLCANCLSRSKHRSDKAAARAATA